MSKELASCCYCETGSLVHQQVSLTKRGTIIPIFQLRRKLAWGIGMSYKCSNPKCNANVNSWDAVLIHSLPFYMQRMYPCAAKWMQENANQALHYSRDLATSIEHNIVTTSSAQAVSKLLAKSFSDLYLKDAEIYYESLVCATQQRGGVPFVTFSEWLGSISLPSGEQLQDAYESAKRSIHTPSGRPDTLRYTLELQATGAKLTSALDHTFQTIKNYRGVLGETKPEAIFTQGNEIGEINTVLVVADTKMSSAAHGLEQVVRRPNFRPKILYSDIFPKLQDLFQVYFGDTVTGHLGLFHYLNRVTRTLRSDHPDFYPAIKGLKECVYQLDPSNQFAVVEALRTGAMNGRKHGSEEIMKLQQSKKWLAKYGKYMRKMVYSAELIRDKLDKWWVQFKINGSTGKSGGKGKLHAGKGVFTVDSRDAYLSALKHAEYITDIIPYDELYNVFDPPRGAKHTCRTYQLMRGAESNLECFHDSLSNFANTGMKPSLADVITMQGISEYNLRKRVAHLHAADPAKRQKIHPSFRGIPFCTDESRLSRMNEMAVKAGVPAPFSDMRELSEDNGERFLWSYFEQQKERDKTIGVTVAGTRCVCEKCVSNVKPLPHAMVLLEDDESKDEQNFFDATGDATGEFDETHDFEVALGLLPLAPPVPRPIRPRTLGRNTIKRRYII